MSMKAMNFKMDDADILELKEVAFVYRKSMTDIIREAIKEHVAELKQDPFYRLTANVADASDEETEEILTEIANMDNDDLTIVSKKKITV